METRTVLIIVGLVASWALLQFVIFPRLGVSCCSGKGCGGSACKDEETGCSSRDACDAPASPRREA